MINRNSHLSLVKQCQVLEMARSGVYYQPKEASEENWSLMRIIDDIHLEKPFLGVRRIRDALHRMGYSINHKRVHRLMRQMDIQAI